MESNSRRTSENFWTTSSFTFKFYLLLTSSLFIVGMFMPVLYSQLLLDNSYVTIYFHSYSNMFVSMVGTAPKLMSIINIGFSFLWLHKLLGESEESTIYKLVEVLLINFEVHFLFNIICLAILCIFDVVDQSMLLGYGWFHVILVYQFRQSVVNPDADRHFCFIPFSIRGKYYPYVVLFVILALSQQFLCLLATTLICLYQQVYKKQMLIRLPYTFYTFLDKLIPSFIQSRYDYTLTSTNRQKIIPKCWFAEVSGKEEATNSHAVFRVGDAVELGGRYKNHANGYKQYWEYRNNQMEVDSVQIYKEMEERQRERQNERQNERQKAVASWLQEERKRQQETSKNTKSESEDTTSVQDELSEEMNKGKKGKFNKLREQLIYD